MPQKIMPTPLGGTKIFSRESSKNPCSLGNQYGCPHQCKELVSIEVLEVYGDGMYLNPEHSGKEKRKIGKGLLKMISGSRKWPKSGTEGITYACTRPIREDGELIGKSYGRTFD